MAAVPGCSSGLGPYPAPLPDPPASEGGQPWPPKRWPRASRACDTCRDRKSKCDQQCPCSHCSYYALKCVYRPTAPSRRRRVGKQEGSRSSIAKSQRGQIQPNQGRQSQHESRNFVPITPNERQCDDDITLPDSVQTRTGQVTNAVEHCNEGDERMDRDGEVGKHTVQEDRIANIDTMDTLRLGGINTVTSGREFYGGSSGLALLARLFAKARERAGTSSYNEMPTSSVNGTARAQVANREPRHLNSGQSSLVDLMYSSDYQYPLNDVMIFDQEGNGDSPDAAIAAVGVRDAPICQKDNDQETSSNGPAGNLPKRNRRPSSLSILKQPTNPDDELLEKYYIEAYFTNVHYIHPLLDEKDFSIKCAQNVWSSQSRLYLTGHKSKFLALYYAVVALGIINSADQRSSCPTYYRQLEWDEAASNKRSTSELATLYFTRCRQLLGNTMETSSLETCQALFLMTVFCQNALKPHACYMYSGTAVRTALAIGLAHDTCPSQTAEIQRTWWCMYSHEIEMCCSSGRLDSLMPPEYYPLPMPQSSFHSAEPENQIFAIIPVMVDIAQVLKRASMEIYCKGRRQSMDARSHISLQLNDELTQWKDNLPQFLNFDIESLDDPEWAYKQKLVLKMRFYNARIVINWPLLVTSDFSEFPRHVDLCLGAARQTIQLMHNAFANRTYLRTWWYCTTYTLYASMTILYLVLMQFPRVPGEELIADVEKSLEIFSAMKQVAVARRCAELTKEILAVIKKHIYNVRQRQAPNAVISDQHMVLNMPFQISESQIPDEGNVWTDASLFELLNQELLGWEKGNALAHMFDPNVLENFALFEEQPFTSLDTMADTLGGGV